MDKELLKQYLINILDEHITGGAISRHPWTLRASSYNDGNKLRIEIDDTEITVRFVITETLIKED